MTSLARHPALALLHRLVPGWCWGVAWGYGLAAVGLWLAGWPQVVPYLLGLLVIQVAALVGPRLLHRDAAEATCAICGPPSPEPALATTHWGTKSTRGSSARRVQPVPRG